MQLPLPMWRLKLRIDAYWGVGMNPNIVTAVFTPSYPQSIDPKAANAPRNDSISITIDTWLSLASSTAQYLERDSVKTLRVIALHGWGRTHRDFDVCLEGLNAISIDLPGFGVSPPPTHAGGAAMYADLISPLLDTCRTPIVVVGHSFGGRVAVHLAEQRPAAIGGLF